MYQRFYGLRELPFELTPNPRFLFLPPRHREALSNLQYGLSSAKAITVLIGEAGTGKTTLLRAALESEPCRHGPARLFEQSGADAAGFRPAAGDPVRSQRAGTRIEGRVSRRSWNAFCASAAPNGTLRRCRRRGAKPERRAARGTTAAGQYRNRRPRSSCPSFWQDSRSFTPGLNDPALRQLKQRVALRCEIASIRPLGNRRLHRQPHHRRRVASASRLFTREAVALIHEYSGGIPRTISVLCDNALVNGMALGPANRRSLNRRRSRA